MLNELKAPPLIRGKKIVLQPFTSDHLSDQYLSWLNDPAVNEFSRRRFFRSDRASAESFLRSLSSSDLLLAINAPDLGFGHVGNIQATINDPHSGCVEIRIMIGEKGVWGKGIGTDAIGALSNFLFRETSTHRIEANSCNPAFIKCVERLNWKHEGCLRSRFFNGEHYLDYHYFGILRAEYTLNS